MVAGSVSSMGLMFEIRALTDLEDKSAAGVEPLTLNDLVVDVDSVEIRGFQQGVAIVTVELDRQDPQLDALLRGPVTAFDASAGTVEILGVTVFELAGTTSYAAANEAAVSRSQFFNLLEVGTLVEAKWDVFDGPSDIADELNIEEE